MDAELDFTPDILEALGTPEVDLSDMEDVVLHHTKFFNQTGPASRIAATRQFRGWIHSPSSRKLLVSGDGECMTHNALTHALGMSGLSIFCATLVQSLRNRQTAEASSRHYVLSCFMGCRGTDRQLFGLPPRRWRATDTMKSLITQLLQQMCEAGVGVDLLPTDLTPDRITNLGDDALSVAKLLRLFRHLLQQLGHDVTVFCIIDSADFYNPNIPVEMVNMTKMWDYLHAMLVDGEDGEDVWFPGTWKLLLTMPRRTVSLDRFRYTVQSHLKMSNNAVRQHNLFRPRVLLEEVIQCAFDDPENRLSGEEVPGVNRPDP